MAVIQLSPVQKSTDDLALSLSVVEHDHRSGQFDEQLAQGGAAVIAHPVDFFDVGQPQFVAHILSHAPTRFADQQVHQLESLGARRVFDVDPPRHLGGQHSLGLIVSAVSRDLRGPVHKSQNAMHICDCQMYDFVPICDLSVPICDLSVPICDL